MHRRVQHLDMQLNALKKAIDIASNINMRCENNMTPFPETDIATRDILTFIRTHYRHAPESCTRLWMLRAILKAPLNPIKEHNFSPQNAHTFVLAFTAKTLSPQHFNPTHAEQTEHTMINATTVAHRLPNLLNTIAKHATLALHWSTYIKHTILDAFTPTQPPKHTRDVQTLVHDTLATKQSNEFYEKGRRFVATQLMPIGLVADFETWKQYDEKTTAHAHAMVQKNPFVKQEWNTMTPYVKTSWELYAYNYTHFHTHGYNLFDHTVLWGQWKHHTHKEPQTTKPWIVQTGEHHFYICFRQQHDKWRIRANNALHAVGIWLTITQQHISNITTT